MKDYYNDLNIVSGNNNEQIQKNIYETFSWEDWQDYMDNDCFKTIEQLDFIDRLEIANSLIINSKESYAIVSELVAIYVNYKEKIEKLTYENNILKTKLEKYL